VNKHHFITLGMLFLIILYHNSSRHFTLIANKLKYLLIKNIKIYCTF
jgi:hypothetical protein